MALRLGDPNNFDAFIRCNMCGRTDQEYGGDGAMDYPKMMTTMAAHVSSHTPAEVSAYLLRLQVGLGPVVIGVQA